MDTLALRSKTVFYIVQSVRREPRTELDFILAVRPAALFGRTSDQSKTIVGQAAVFYIVQTVATGSVQSRPPVFVDWMKTVSPVRGSSRLPSTNTSARSVLIRHPVMNSLSPTRKNIQNSYLDPSHTIDR